MLSTGEIVAVLRRSKRRLSKYGVSSVGLFGSSARGNARVESDIDILLDFKRDKETYANLMSACDLLEKELEGERLDIVTRKGLSPYIGKYILNEVLYV